jgi:signal transduction histidine kinase
VRRRLLVATAASTALVLLAFLVPLLVLVRQSAADRAVAEATRAVQALVPVVALGDDTSINAAAAAAGAQTPGVVTVVLPSGAVVGEQGGTDAASSAAVQTAQAGASATAQTADGGREIAVPVSKPDGTWVVRAEIPPDEVSRGVASASIALIALAAAVFAMAMLVADRIARSVVGPARSAAAAAHRLADGDLSARAATEGPPEIAEVGRSLNLLGDRISGLLQDEREAVADLSHRLRTPVTALRLDAEGLPEGPGRERVLDDVDALSREVDALIAEVRRPVREGATLTCDAAVAVRERVAFWSALADDQGRSLTLTVAVDPLPARLDRASLDAALDALIGNVFAHTPDGSAASVWAGRDATGLVTVRVEDAGPGIAPEALARGASGAGSTGLGLDIARRAAEAAGGGLLVRPRPGGGSVVELTLGAHPPQPA